ncbi:hypothetical protein J28TS4_21640 [Paenibacillus lautus]|uniref:hypothetical protein n=1 Tax=Paenibacillus lautus TaxID=1401 RepID=UPI001B197F2D|nr:hypothetical protein [Paenibacillus lautus]GIP03757.1 hypothetical protein J28TS4_21640 [Paenibacillus lautus]
MFGRGNQKYPIPATLLKLKEMNEQIVHDLEVELDDILEIYMDYDLNNQDAEFAYSGHPLDVIPFAFTAFGGEHFGFLTDFGSVTDLEDAPVVFVQALPSEEFHVTLIARNIRDYLGLFLTYKCMINMFSTVNEPSQEPSAVETHPHLSAVEAKLIHELGIQKIEPVSYRQNMLRERSKEVVQTINGIGVKRMTACELGPTFNVEEYDKYDVLNNKVREFFQEACLESKLACIADLQEAGILLTHTYDLNEFLINELRAMGCIYESRILELTTKSYDFSMSSTLHEIIPEI